MICEICGTEWDYTGSPYTYIEWEADKVTFAMCVHGKSTARRIPSIEEVWKITDKCPSLTGLLREAR